MFMIDSLYNLCFKPFLEYFNVNIYNYFKRQIKFSNSLSFENG